MRKTRSYIGGDVRHIEHGREGSKKLAECGPFPVSAEERAVLRGELWQLNVNRVCKRCTGSARHRSLDCKAQSRSS